MIYQSGNSRPRNQNGGIWPLPPDYPTPEETRAFAREILTDPARRRQLSSAPDGMSDELHEFLAGIRTVHEAGWDPAKHPRRGGAPNAGWFAPTGEEGGGARDGGTRKKHSIDDPLKREEVWNAAKKVVTDRGLPSAIIDWNHANNTRIEHGKEAEYKPFRKTIQLRKQDTHQIIRASEDSTLTLGTGVLHNEAFHAWYDQQAKGTWYGNVVRNQSQYGWLDRSDKSEEAASEMVHSTITHMENGKKPPSHGDAKKQGITISPDHNGPGEIWAGHKDTKEPMSEEMYYATLWAMYNGTKDPGADASGSRLPSLKKWFRELKDPVRRN